MDSRSMFTARDGSPIYDQICPFLMIGWVYVRTDDDVVAFHYHVRPFLNMSMEEK